MGHGISIDGFTNVDIVEGTIRRTLEGNPNLVNHMPGYKGEKTIEAIMKEVRQRTKYGKALYDLVEDVICESMSSRY